MDQVATPGGNAESVDPLIGAKLGRYIMRRRLGEGGFGSIYLGTHEDLGMQRVFKVMHPKVAEDGGMRLRFRQEAEAAVKLKHRYIVDVTDFGTTPDGRPYLEMEYLDGQTLSEYVWARGGKLDPYIALRFAMQLAVALTVAHAHGVVHRDLKPDNVFVLRDGTIKLLDFGVAKVTVRAAPGGPLATIEGQSVGTPGYMAPEQYGAAATATPQADVFSLAVILWEMIAGSRPWAEAEVAATEKKDIMILRWRMQAEPPVRPAGMTEECFAVLAPALAIERDARPPSVRALVEGLARWTKPPNLGAPSVDEMFKRYAPEFGEARGPTDQTVKQRTDEQRPPATTRDTTISAAMGTLTTKAPRRAWTFLGFALLVVTAAVVAIVAVASKSHDAAATAPAVPVDAPRDVSGSAAAPRAGAPDAQLDAAPDAAAVAPLDAPKPSSVDGAPASAPLDARPTRPRPTRPPATRHDDVPLDLNSPDGR